MWVIRLFSGCCYCCVISRSRVEDVRVFAYAEIATTFDEVVVVCCLYG
jgi:hypothetical protein